MLGLVPETWPPGPVILGDVVRHGDFMVISWWFHGDFMVIQRWLNGIFMGFKGDLVMT